MANCLSMVLVAGTEGVDCALMTFTVISLVAAFLLYKWSLNRDRQRTLENGVDLIGIIVQANSTLFENGLWNQPAQVLVSFPGDKQANVQQLAEISHRLGRLKTAMPLDDVEK